MQWLNFMIIIQVTKKVLIVFFSPKEILLDTNTFSVSTSSKNLEPYCGKKNFFFNFNLPKNFFTHFRFFRSKQYFSLSLWPHFC